MIIQYGLGFASRVKNLENKEIEDWKEDKLYEKGAKVLYNNYLWVAKVTNQSSTWNENYWEKVGDDLELIEKSDIEAMINLSDEEIASLQSLISTEIRLDKCFSSSDAYNRILNAENECKKFTLEQLAKKAGVVYKIVADTTGVDSTEFLYLISNGSNGYNIYAYIDGSAVKISDTNINLDSYAKLTDLDNYYDKATSDGKYATITTVDGKVDKTSILSTISNTPSDDKLLSEKAINDTLVKKTDIVDNLTSTNTDKPLSANQGKVLKGEVDKKANDNEVIKKTAITTTINSSSADTQVPSAKSVYNEMLKLGSNPNVYTLDEQVVGKWIDGKPIYRKVIEFTSSYPALSIQDVDKLIARGGHIATTGASPYNILPFPWMRGAEQSDLFVVRGKTLNWIASGINLHSTITSCVWIEYTKKTD